ncbi:MAG: FlgO family outer membrane protein [Campylobacterota bacterium]|nr:FlgO family outer membrane protein [Campylobacterota bacterium]
MIKQIIKGGILVSLVFGLTGCTVNTPNEPTKVEAKKIEDIKLSSHGEIDDKIKILADKLLASSRLTQKDLGNIAVTSFVDLHQLNKTTPFGRFLGEGIFNELFVRGFNLVDFRAQEALSVNADGEFFITRDVKKINDTVNNTYILVGTYSYMNGRVLLNARIMDNQSGRLVATAKTHYVTKDCKLIGDCPKPKAPRTIRVTTDNCSTVNCPNNYCEGGICRK